MKRGGKFCLAGAVCAAVGSIAYIVERIYRSHQLNEKLFEGRLISRIREARKNRESDVIPEEWGSSTSFDAPVGSDESPKQDKEVEGDAETMGFSATARANAYCPYGKEKRDVECLEHCHRVQYACELEDDSYDSDSLCPYLKLETQGDPQNDETFIDFGASLCGDSKFADEKELSGEVEESYEPDDEDFCLSADWSEQEFADEAELCGGSVEQAPTQFDSSEAVSLGFDTELKSNELNLDTLGTESASSEFDFSDDDE